MTGPVAVVRGTVNGNLFISTDAGATWTPWNGGSGGATIGAAVPATATAVAVKDNAGNLAYPLLDGAGNLKVALTGAGSGGTSAVDGAGYAAGVTAGTPTMVARDDADTQLANAAVGLVRGTAHRALHVNLRDNAGTEVVAATSALQTTGNTSLGNISTVEGATTDAAVTGDNNGTISAKLRGLSKILADVWDSVNHILKVTLNPLTSGGTSSYHAVSAGSNNAVAIKAATAGQVYGVHVFNNAAYPVYVKLYDTAGAPNPAVDTVKRTIGVQAGVRADDLLQFGLPFVNGIGIAIVKGITNTDNIAVLASDCVVDVDYK